MKVSREECKLILYELTNGAVISAEIDAYLDAVFDNPSKMDRIGLERFILRTFMKWFYKP